MENREGGESVDMDKVTIQDCIDMWEKKGKCVILDGGKVAGFEEE